MSTSIIQDSSGQTWEFAEIQALVNQVGSLQKAAVRLDTTSRQLRIIGIQTPCEYVRDEARRDAKWLINQVLRLNSINAVAVHLNVSNTFLKNLLNEIGYSTAAPEPTAEDAKRLLEKFGSSILVARMLNTTPNVIKKLVPEWRDLKDPTKAGNHSIRTGKLAETYYADRRGDKITHDPSANNHNHEGYDFVDSEYGKVNVKAAVVSSTGRYCWELNPLTHCDAFALVQMDENKQPVGWFVVTKGQISGDTNMPSGATRDIRCTGKVAVIYRPIGDFATIS